MKAAPFQALDLAPPLVERIALKDGGFLLRSPVPLKPYAPSIAHLLRHRAAETPEHDFLAERSREGGWRRRCSNAAHRRNGPCCSFRATASTMRC
jgi:hypothetical protein